VKKKNEGIVWENISIRLRQEEKEALCKIAEEEDLPLPVYVKRLLRREIRKASLPGLVPADPLPKGETQEPDIIIRTADGKETRVPLVAPRHNDTGKTS
jgi:hypothetical protein